MVVFFSTLLLCLLIWIKVVGLLLKRQEELDGLRFYHVAFFLFFSVSGMVTTKTMRWCV